MTFYGTVTGSLHLREIEQFDNGIGEFGGTTLDICRRPITLLIDRLSRFSKRTVEF